ncbi:MAG: VOC family protein [Chloroflexota bacterium]
MPVIEFRVVLTAEEFEKITAFYRDGLGLDPGAMWTEHGQGQIFGAGRATLEILDTTHTAYIDQIEAGKQVSGRLRFAFEVPDLLSALERALNHGATLVNGPERTPWHTFNARLQTPDGLQVTLFEVMD